MSITDIFFKLFPFLFSALRRAFNAKPHEQQMALINGSIFTQVIRNNYLKGYDAILAGSNEGLGWSAEITGSMIMELARRKAWEMMEPYELPTLIKTQLTLLPAEASQDDFFNSMAGQVAIIQNNDIKWRDIAIGLTEFAFRNFVKGKIL